MFLEHQIGIRMISEGSCDTEDRSKDAENLKCWKFCFASQTYYILKYITIENRDNVIMNNHDYIVTVNNKELLVKKNW